MPQLLAGLSRVKVGLRFPVSQRITPIGVINGLIFVALNLGDAWLTNELLGMGWSEINPIVVGYGNNLLIKGLLSLVITAALLKFGKGKLLWPLNVFMLGVVVWHCAGFFGLV